MIPREFGAALACLVVVASAAAQNRTVKLNGGLEAEILTMGRSADHENLTVSMRVSNKGKGSAYLLLLGFPVVTDNIGGGFQTLASVSGIARCVGNPESHCFGSPKIVDSTVPLQAFTLVDPNVDIIVNFRFGNGSSKGPLISLSANLAYRLVNDIAKDATLPDGDKYKQFKVMSLSFPPMSITDAK